MKKYSFVLFASALLAAFSFTHKDQNKDNQLTSQEKKDGWQLLFDGKSLNGWRTFKTWKALRGRQLMEQCAA